MNNVEMQMLQEHINMIVENFIDEEFLAEKGKKDKKPHYSTKWEKKAGRQDKKKGETSDDRKERHKNKAKTKAAARRARVIAWLNDPSVNCAEIMRKLWKPNPKKEDSARSYFYKCRDGKLNDSGVPYSFSDKEINKLYAIKNNLI